MGYQLLRYTTMKVSDPSSYSESPSESITNDNELILFESNSDYSEESQSSEYDNQSDDNEGCLQSSLYSYNMLTNI